MRHGLRRKVVYHDRRNASIFKPRPEQMGLFRFHACGNGLHLSQSFYIRSPAVDIQHLIHVHRLRDYAVTGKRNRVASRRTRDWLINSS